MKKIFNKHPEAFLVTLAIFFLAIIIGGFAWGIGSVIAEVNRSVNFNGQANEKPGFDIKDAKALNLHGLVQ